MWRVKCSLIHRIRDLIPKWRLSSVRPSVCETCEKMLFCTRTRVYTRFFENYDSFSVFFFIFPFSCFKDINYFEKFLFLNNSLESWQKLWRERNREKVSSNSDWALILFCFTVTSQEIFEKYRSITELLGLADSTIIATLDSFGNRGSKAGRSAFLFFCRFRMLRKSAKLIFWYR